MYPRVVDCSSCGKPFLLSVERTQRNKPQVCVHCQAEIPLKMPDVPGMVSLR